MTTKAAVAFLQIASGATPAPGAEFTLRAPGQGIWRVMSLAFTFTASVAVANRRISLVADDQTDVFWAAESSVDVAATATVRFSAYPGADTSGLTGVLVSLPLPNDGLILQPGHRVRSITNLIDVADQFTLVRAQVQEYPQGPNFEFLPVLTTQIAEMS